MIKTVLYPVRSRLILALVIALMPVTVAMIVISWNGSREQLAQANESTQNFAFIAAGYQKQLLSDLKQLVTILAEEPDLHVKSDSCSRSLTKIAATVGDYNSISITDQDGAIICGTNNGVPVNISDLDYFKQARQSLQFTLSDLRPDHTGRSQEVIGAMPWANENGDFAGMAVASIETSRFASSFKDMPLPVGSKYFLLDRHGALIAGEGTLSKIVAAHLRDHPPSPKMMTPFIVREDDGLRSYTSISIEGGALNVLIGIPRHTYRNFGFENLLVSILGPVALLAFMIGIVWYLGDRLVTAPVTSLIRTARAYSRGDLTTRPQTVNTGGELRELSLTFAEMADRIAKRENELQDAIQRRELMLREIHHRVKNNLQIVISLVNLQSKSVSIPAAQGAFTEIQTRMRALALVHRYLYESDDLQSVNIGAFLAELCTSLQVAYGVSPVRVPMEIVTETVWDISDRAIPLALFITETISNALRHGFPDDRTGFIKVHLKNLGDNQAVFSVEDNGIGIETETKDQQPASKILAGLGMSLIKAFSRQVDGELKISGPPGTLISLHFKCRSGPGTSIA